MPEEDLVEAAAAARPVAQVVELTRWVGPGRKLTQTRRLTMNDTRTLVELLQTGDEIDPRIGDRVFRTRSSEDLRELTLVAHWAREAGLLRRARAARAGEEERRPAGPAAAAVDRAAWLPLSLTGTCRRPRPPVVPVRTISRQVGTRRTAGPRPRTGGRTAAIAPEPTYDSVIS